MAYCDEAGFASAHPNRSAWTPVGECHTSEALRGKRLNVVGALLSSGDLFTVKLWETMTAVLFAGFLGRSMAHVGKPLVVILDYAYRCDKGHFERLFQGVQQPDLEEIMIDSTCCRAHPSLGGGSKESRPPGHRHHARGSELPNIHAVCDALGSPLRFVLEPGATARLQASARAARWVAGKALLAGKAYGSDKIVQAAQAQGMQVIVPSKANRKQQRPSTATRRGT